MRQILLGSIVIVVEGEGDDATRPRLAVVASRFGTEEMRKSRVSRPAQRLVHPVGGISAMIGTQWE